MEWNGNGRERRENVASELEDQISIFSFRRGWKKVPSIGYRIFAGCKRHISSVVLFLWYSHKNGKILRVKGFFVFYCIGLAQRLCRTTFFNMIIPRISLAMAEFLFPTTNPYVKLSLLLEDEKKLVFRFSDEKVCAAERPSSWIQSSPTVSFPWKKSRWPTLSGVRSKSHQNLLITLLEDRIQISKRKSLYRPALNWNCSSSYIKRLYLFLIKNGWSSNYNRRSRVRNQNSSNKVPKR